MTRQDEGSCRSCFHGSRRTILVTILVVVFGSALALVDGRGSNAVAQQREAGQIVKPFLVIEGRFDRRYVDDLYAFAMDGTLIKRLTSEPLPASQLVAVAPVSGDPFFVANASAFYGLSLRNNILSSIHSANVRVAAVSPDGGTTAFVIAPDPPPGIGTVPGTVRNGADAAPPLIVRVMPVLAGSPFRPSQFALPAGVVPTEMTFAPDGTHVLITDWPRDRTARLLTVDLSSGASRTVLADDGLSYYEPVFAPDGASLLAVREDWRAGRWSIVSLAWPTVQAPTIVLTSPRGVELSTPIFLADGVRFMFQQERALARATLDGGTVEALAEDLNPTDRAWPLGIIDRGNPARAGWMPRVVSRYFARIEGHERANPADDPVADVVVSDIQTKRTTIPVRGGPILAAVVVE